MIAIIIYYFISTCYALGMLETFEKNNDSLKEKARAFIISIVVGWLFAPYSFGVDFCQHMEKNSNP